MSIFDNIKPLTPAWPVRPWERRVPRPTREQDAPPRDQQHPSGDQQKHPDKPGHIDEYA